MKKTFLSLLLILSVIVTFAQVKVRGYTKKNGTYVAPYTRSSPDSNPYNNYSYPGNTNPYTGKVATGNPDTYLNNYYNKNYKIASVDDKIYLTGNSNVGGRYLKCYSSDESKQSFYIYNSSDVYDGFVIVHNTGKIEIFDKNGNFEQEINANDSQVSRAPTTSTSYPNNTFQNNESPKKIYLKDRNGNYSGLYAILTDEDETVKKYKLYNAVDEQEGYLTVFSNGEKFVYDIYKNLRKHIIPEKKKR